MYFQFNDRTVVIKGETSRFKNKLWGKKSGFELDITKIDRDITSNSLRTEDLKLSKRTSSTHLGIRNEGCLGGFRDVRIRYLAKNLKNFRRWSVLKKLQREANKRDFSDIASEIKSPLEIKTDVSDTQIGVQLRKTNPLLST